MKDDNMGTGDQRACTCHLSGPEHTAVGVRPGPQPSAIHPHVTCPALGRQSNARLLKLTRTPQEDWAEKANATGTRCPE